MTEPKGVVYPMINEPIDEERAAEAYNESVEHAVRLDSLPSGSCFLSPHGDFYLKCEPCDCENCAAHPSKYIPIVALATGAEMEAEPDEKVLRILICKSRIAIVEPRKVSDDVELEVTTRADNQSN